MLKGVGGQDKEGNIVCLRDWPGKSCKVFQNVSKHGLSSGRCTVDGVSQAGVTIGFILAVYCIGQTVGVSH